MPLPITIRWGWSDMAGHPLECIFDFSPELLGIDVAGEAGNALPLIIGIFDEGRGALGQLERKLRIIFVAIMDRVPVTVEAVEHEGRDERSHFAELGHGVG